MTTMTISDYIDKEKPRWVNPAGFFLYLDVTRFAIRKPGRYTP
jgi:hypothetical protein